MPKQPTIKDVARLSGVSIATVSRVINEADNVNPDTKEKVMQVISKLNYKPNRIARGLKNNTTNTIGIIVSNIANPFFMNVIREIEKKLKSAGYSLILGSSDDNQEKENEYIKLFNEKQIDGLIISSTGKNEDYLIELQKTGLPIICIDRRAKNNKLNSVFVDKKDLTYRMVKYLVSRGHREIALATGSKDLITNFDRYLGYNEAFFDLDLKINNDYLFFSEFSVDFGKCFLKKILTKSTIPTAIISGSSLITEGILIQAQHFGLEIPTDFSLITFGNIDMSELIKPKLTYADPMADIIGQQSAELLLNKLKLIDNNIETVNLKAEIIENDSVITLFKFI